MKYLFKLLMMFIAYNGFAQGGENQRSRRVITFPNGNESITIIENNDKNVIQLTATESVNVYDMLDLSNHEDAHRQSKKRGILRRTATDQLEDQYVIGRDEKEPSREVEEQDESSGA